MTIGKAMALRIMGGGRIAIEGTKVESREDETKSMTASKKGSLLKYLINRQAGQEAAACQDKAFERWSGYI